MRLTVGLKGLANGETILKTWRVLSGLPGGKRAFSRLIGAMAPYTATIGALVLDLAPGHSRVQLRDRRAVRNHLDSVHAIALLNLAEMSTGLAIMCGLPAGGRGILRGLSITYEQKARGTLVAECDCAIPTTVERAFHIVPGVIRDRAGHVVARAEANWLIGPG